MVNSKRKEILILLLCLIVGFALRFYTFDQKSLWMDEVHTFNDSRDDLKDQIKFYKGNPSFLHPPLFFILTHQFYPFTKPERDLRIIPLIFGTLSIPMIYLLARSFSPSIALPCTLSLTFMTYHISLSQDGRCYSLLMFLGMTGLYFFMKHLLTSRKGYLVLVAFFFSTLFYTSYSSIPFIILSQILWFYRPSDEVRKPKLSSFLVLNGLILLFCLPWILFLLFNYKGHPLMDPFHTESPGSFFFILYGILNDWVPHAPLMIITLILFILFLLFSKSRKNALILLALFIFPIGGLNLFCKLFKITHYVTSKYFICFLPIFFITLFLSLDSIEVKFNKLKRFLRPKLLFLILLIASNLIVLPLYYRSEKEDLRRLVNYLKLNLQEGDNIFINGPGQIPGILHYFGYHPEGRHHMINVWKDSEKRVEVQKPFVYRNKIFIIFYTRVSFQQHLASGSRLWIIVDKLTAKKLKERTSFNLKGYFDGSFQNLYRFPTDGSLYLFLWDPKSQEENGIELPIE